MSKQLKLTSQTKWNWSLKYFYIVFKLANKPLFRLEKERVGAHSLLSIKLEKSFCILNKQKGFP